MQVPPPFNLREVRSAMDSRSDPDPLKVVLLQEVERYNQMLTFVHGTLRDLEKAMQGLVSVTALLETIMLRPISTTPSINCVLFSMHSSD